MFKRGAGPLLGPAQKGSGTGKEGLECGVPEFGGRALSEGVWAGLRLSALEGVSESISECRGRALGGGVGARLGFCTAGGRL